MSKKTKQLEQKIDCVIVGAGPAGLLSWEKYKNLYPDQECVLLEAAPHSGGRAKSALHLLDSEVSSAFTLLTSSLYSPFLVRWERQWIPFSDVDWSSKEWVAELPQWKIIGKGLKSILLDVPETNEEIKCHSPVSFLKKVGDLWHVGTPECLYQSRKVIWAAGLKAFQNAFGKHEAQDYLVSNESYDSVAADYRGGIAVELELPLDTLWEEGFDKEAVFGLPVRFEGKFHLMVGALHEEEGHFSLKAWAHVHQDLLVDPKLVGAFQKSLRRGIRSLFSDELTDKSQERWVVNDRILGHKLGTAWLFDAHGADSSLNFVGDETNSSSFMDTVGAMDSVNKVFADS